MNLPTRFLGVTIENYVIMPNHVHLLIIIDESDAAGGGGPSPTLNAVICAFKSLTVRSRKRINFYEKSGFILRIYNAFYRFVCFGIFYNPLALPRGIRSAYRRTYSADAQQIH